MVYVNRNRRDDMPLMFRLQRRYMPYAAAYALPLAALTPPCFSIAYASILMIDFHFAAMLFVIFRYAAFRRYHYGAIRRYWFRRYATLFSFATAALSPSLLSMRHAIHALIFFGALRLYVTIRRCLITLLMIAMMAYRQRHTARNVSAGIALAGY